MPNQKSKKKSAKPKKAAATKSKPPAKTLRKKPAKRKAALKKKKVTATKNAPVRKTAAVKTKTAGRRRAPVKDRDLDLEVFKPHGQRGRPGGQSGDLQGLSDVEGANSESVDELLEEGNAFEADIVSGVEKAGDNEGQEVHTHEVPEDDVPEEYLDKD
jgi:hypothetical protein